MHRGRRHIHHLNWSIQFDDARDAPAARREFVEHLLVHADAQSDFGAAELAFDELLANVVRHAPGAVRIDLEWTKSAPILHVRDSGPAFTPPLVLPQSPLSESGRGLYLVVTLVGPLSVHRCERGNRVSVSLPVYRKADAPIVAT